MLKIISSTIPYSGQCSPGYNVIMSYYAQHQIDGLNYNNTILEELAYTDSDYTELELRSVLGSFLFSGDDVFKKIGNLSGGEKARVALAKVLISKANFLVMDEPTNHLDISSVDILTSALQQYKGSIIMVSHDRQFINEVANKIWYIADKKIKEYPGTYSDYEFWMSQTGLKKDQKPKKANSVNSRNQKVKSFEAQKKNKNQLNSLKTKLENLELSISRLEMQKASIEQEMHLPETYTDYGKLGSLDEELKSIKIKIKEQHLKWEDLYLEIEEFEKANF